MQGERSVSTPIIFHGGACLHLAFLRGDDGVARDNWCEDAACGLDTQRERVNVEEGDAGRVTADAREDGALDGGAIGDSLVWVDASRRLLSEIILEKLLHLRDTRRATNENNLPRARVNSKYKKYVLQTAPRGPSFFVTPASLST